MFESTSEIPEVDASDPEPVAVAIETARALFRSGEALDGLRWLRRAAERAEESGDDLRALNLARSAADLSTALQSVAPPTPPAASVPPAARPPSAPPPAWPPSVPPPARPPSAPPAARPPSVAPPPPPSVKPARSIAPLPIVPVVGGTSPVQVAAPFDWQSPPRVEDLRAPGRASSEENVADPRTLRGHDEAVAPSPDDDFSDKTIVDALSNPVGRDALQSAVQITELPRPAHTGSPYSATMPSPASSGSVARAQISPPIEAAPSARRAALRVAIALNPDSAGSWVVRALPEGGTLPPGFEEALLVSLDANSKLF